MSFDWNIGSGAGWVLAALLGLGIIILTLRYCSQMNRTRAIRRDAVTGGMSESEFAALAGKLLTTQADSFAMVAMQISNMPRIVRAFGAEQGRAVLRDVSMRLSKQLSREELMARTGEDTFRFLLKNRGQEDVCIRLNRICAAVNPADETASCPPELLFGICLPEKGENDPDMLWDRAVTACRTMPVDARYHFFDAGNFQKTARDRALAEAIPHALQTGEFVVVYQPKIRLSDHKVVGAEALSRWRHPRLGLLSPDMFLPVAEQYRKIGLIDRFVIRQVCQTLARWKKQGRELCRISLNLAGEDLEDTGFADECSELCRRYEVEPSLIEFEFKEKLLLENQERAATLMNRLHALGFHCAVDNFGADLISLQLLSRLDIDTVKIDGSFFSGNQDNSRGRYIVEALLKLTTQLHIQTVAEEIDSSGQLEFLKSAACDMIQGFCFFKPMAAERFEDEVYTGTALCYARSRIISEQEKAEKRPSAVGQSVQNAKSIILFSWNTREDTVEFSEIFSPVLGNQRKFENARALFRTTDLIYENDREDFFRLLERCQREEGWLENTLRFCVGEGRYGWLELRLRQEHRAGDIISGTMVNLAEWKKEVERWREKAIRDALTGLYNRDYYESNVRSQLSQKAFESAAVLFIDVDDFKQVNDTLGHRFGDDVLCYVAKQILGVFRHTDIIARYAGDEFVVFAPYIQQNTLEDRLKKLCSAFSYPYRNDTVEYRVSCSVGAAMFPRDGTEYQRLLHTADCALYEAKKRGKNQFVVFESYMEDQHADEGEPTA